MTYGKPCRRRKCFSLYRSRSDVSSSDGNSFLYKQDAKQQSDGTPIVSHQGGDNPELSARFGIASIPTLIFFKNGEILKKTVGYREKDEFEEMLKELL